MRKGKGDRNRKMENARKRERYDNKNGSKEKEETRERIWR